MAEPSGGAGIYWISGSLGLACLAVAGIADLEQLGARRTAHAYFEGPTSGTERR